MSIFGFLGDTELRDSLQVCVICGAVTTPESLETHVRWHVITGTLGDWTVEGLNRRGDEIKARARDLFAEQGRPVHGQKTWDEIDDGWRTFWITQAGREVDKTPS